MINKLTSILLLLFSICLSHVEAQQLHWVYFTDKCSDWSAEFVHKDMQILRAAIGEDIAQESDLPICSRYVQEISEMVQHPIRVESKWLNAASVLLREDEVSLIEELPFVLGVEAFGQALVPCAEKDVYTDATKFAYGLKYLGAKAITDEGLTGKNVKVGIVDCGFQNADSDPFTTNLFLNKQVIEEKDFVDPSNNDIVGIRETPLDYHGAAVMKRIGGLNADGLQYGLATGAKYFLARTDHGTKEYRAEEDLWIAAIEWMESHGVRLVNSSLGYADDHDDPAEDYHPSQMDGKSTAISKAAEIAATEKGMILVTSAGNEGGKKWRVLSAPADASKVISIGATDLNNRRANYSSVGPKFLNYVKPDVVAYAKLGTSFAAPVIAGLIATILEKYPHLKREELHAALIASAHLYPFPNNHIGYGIPNAEELLQRLEGNRTKEVGLKNVSATKKKIRVKFSEPVPRGQKVIVYYKSEDWKVVKEFTFKGKNKRVVKIRTFSSATSVTINAGFEAYEYKW